MKPSRFAIAATSSGSGKTTLTLGLLRALRRRGLTVQPFKCGPDYIDTTFHKQAAGMKSINLDLFMASENHVGRLFTQHGEGKDVCLMEGVMGLYDGFHRTEGSTYQVAKLLSMPTVLLLDATSSAYSTAATIFGFKHFRNDVNIAGVIFNRVTSPSHFSYLKQACEDCGAECFGFLKKRPDLSTPSRHLGLTLTGEDRMESFIDNAADAVEEGVDIDRLLSATQSGDPCGQNIDDTPCYPPPGKVIGVAYDEAFSFIYPENIDSWKKAGSEILYFSPLRDKSVPERADFLYFPGGYPELYAKTLSENTGVISSVKDFAFQGGKILGECGGLMYLSKDIDGIKMSGILPLRFTMEGAKLTLGYRRLNFTSGKVSGHEFHYSRIINSDECGGLKIQTDKTGKAVDTGIYRHKNTIAGYTHLYWAEHGLPDIWT